MAPPTTSTLELLREVQLDADATDDLELRLEPIDMLFFIHKNFPQELFGRVVTFSRQSSMPSFKSL